jgi:GH18 family chitinase
MNMTPNKIHTCLDWIKIVACDYRGGWDVVADFNVPLYARA